MRLTQRNSRSKTLILLLLMSLSAGFPVLANEEEHKPEEHKSEEHGDAQAKGEGKEGEAKKPEKKTFDFRVKKPSIRLKPVEDANASGEPGQNGKLVLGQAKGCLVDHAALDDLKHAREEIEDRKKELAIRESDLKVREQAVAEELKSLEKTRDEITHSNDAKVKDKEARVTKLVETFLTMSPKSAAKVLAALDDNLAVLSMSQMDTTRLAKIMNNMEARRSSQLSELLVGVKKGKAPSTSKKDEG